MFMDDNVNGKNLFFFFFINSSLGLHLPSFINEINHKGAEDEENEQGNKHVVDSPDVVHLKQLTGGNTSSRRSDFSMSKNKHSDTEGEQQ